MLIMFTFAQAYEHDRPYDGQVDDYGQFQRVFVGHLEFFHKLPLQNYAVEVARYRLFNVVADVRRIRPRHAICEKRAHIQPSGLLVAFTVTITTTAMRNRQRVRERSKSEVGHLPAYSPQFATL